MPQAAAVTGKRCATREDLKREALMKSELSTPLMRS